jgi:uncharacterized RDD family membrane protein YckC
MSRVDHYFKDVRLHLAASSKDKERFISDLRDQANEMLESGMSEAAVLEKLGPPREVAAEFMQFRSLTYANIFQRFFAFFLDASLSTMFIFPGLFLVFLVPLGMADPSIFWSFHWDHAIVPTIHINGIELVLLVLGGLMATGIALLYFPIMEYMFGWTLGKKVMGIRVLSEDGSAITLGAAFVRRLSYYFDILALDAIFILFTSTKQRAFDRVARTVVVKDGEPNILGTLIFIVAAMVFVVLGIYTLTVLAVMPDPIIDIL